MKVTGEMIWSGLMKEEEFAAQPESVKAAIKPFIYAVPGLLEDLLDLPATLSHIVEAKLRFLRDRIDKDFITLVCDAFPEEDIEIARMSRDLLRSTLNELYPEMVNMLEHMSKDLPTFLADNGLTEEQVMISREIGLDGEALRLYHCGELTVGKLLEHQPAVILKDQS